MKTAPAKGGAPSSESIRCATSIPFSDDRFGLHCALAVLHTHARYKPRSVWPRASPGARPRTLVKAQPGVRLQLTAEFTAVIYPVSPFAARRDTALSLPFSRARGARWPQRRAVRLRKTTLAGSKTTEHAPAANSLDQHSKMRYLQRKHCICARREFARPEHRTPTDQDIRVFLFHSNAHPSGGGHLLGSLCHSKFLSPRLG